MLSKVEVSCPHGEAELPNANHLRDPEVAQLLQHELGIQAVGNLQRIRFDAAHEVRVHGG